MVAADKRETRTQSCRRYDSVWHVRHRIPGDLFHEHCGVDIQGRDSERRALSVEGHHQSIERHHRKAAFFDKVDDLYQAD